MATRNHLRELNQRQRAMAEAERIERLKYAMKTTIVVQVPTQKTYTAIMQYIHLTRDRSIPIQFSVHRDYPLLPFKKETVLKLDSPILLGKKFASCVS